MTSFQSLRRDLVRIAIAAAVTVAALPAVAQQGDPPGRVGRLNLMEGSVALSPAGESDWTQAPANRPLTGGDRLWTERGSRAELQLGANSLRMDSDTRLEITALDDQTSQISLNQGTLNVRVRSVDEGENFEIDSPNPALRAMQPGEFRLDVAADGSSTRITVLSGLASVYGESGQAVQIAPGQQITFTGRALSRLSSQPGAAPDAFDRWAAQRNQLEDQSVSARYVPREVPGYLQLDSHGDWAQDPSYGPVWFPRLVIANWAPYRWGHWERIAPWGWTWIDDAPWGFAPTHYGRWARVGSRWAWVPGAMGARPYYAPALVGFVGGQTGGVDWKLQLAPGRAGVAWFPLAPGEVWRPGYRASQVYVGRVNRSITGEADRRNGYVYQHRHEAFTTFPRDDLRRGQRPVPARLAPPEATPRSVIPAPEQVRTRGASPQERIQHQQQWNQQRIQRQQRMSAQEKAQEALRRQKPAPIGALPPGPATHPALQEPGRY